MRVEYVRIQGYEYGNVEHLYGIKVYCGLANLDSLRLLRSSNYLNSLTNRNQLHDGKQVFLSLVRSHDFPSWDPCTSP